MAEDFALIFQHNEVHKDALGAPIQSDADQILSLLGDLSAPQDVDLSVGSWGYGADAITVIVAIAALADLGVSILGQGGHLQENIDGWRDVGRRLREAMGRLKAEFGQVAVSEPAARILAVQVLLERDIGANGLELVSSSTVPVSNVAISQDLVSDFRSQPDRFYVYVFRDDMGDGYIVTLRSTGEVEFVRRLPAGNWQEYLGVG